MALVFKDRVKETTSTTGTGTYTLLGAAAGYQSFADIGDGNTCHYFVSNGVDWESGLGTYTAAGTLLARTTIYESSNADAAVSWGAGTKQVEHGPVAAYAGVTLVDADIGVTVAAFAHNHAGVYEPADATILKDADIGVTVAAFAHTHAGVYEPADATILKDADIGVTVAAFAHNHSGVYEPADATILKDADIGVTVAAFAHNHSGVYEPVFSKNTGFNLNLGTGAGTVSEGNHNHTGVYEPADATILKDADIGVTVAAFAHNHSGVYEPASANLTKDNVAETITAAWAFNGDITTAFEQHTYLGAYHGITGSSESIVSGGSGTTDAVYLGRICTGMHTLKIYYSGWGAYEGGEYLVHKDYGVTTPTIFEQNVWGAELTSLHWVSVSNTACDLFLLFTHSSPVSESIAVRWTFESVKATADERVTFPAVTPPTLDGTNDIVPWKKTPNTGITEYVNTPTVGGTAVSLTTHNHSGVYEPADGTILKDADIGVTVAAFAHNHSAANITSGTLAVLRGGTGVTTKTGTGSVVLSASPVFTGTVDLGTLALVDELRVGDGSVSAPSMTFGGDTNTGFYRYVSTDTYLAVTVGGNLCAEFGFDESSYEYTGIYGDLYVYGQGIWADEVFLADPGNVQLTLDNTVAPSTHDRVTMGVSTTGLFTIDGDGIPIFESQMAATTITYNRFRGPMQFQYGSTGQGFTALFGADAISNGSTLTNVTTKIARVGVPHYTNAEQPMCLFWGQSASGSTSMSIGGGSSLFNTIETLNIYGAANDTTVTGTLLAQFTLAAGLNMQQQGVKLNNLASSNVNTLDDYEEGTFTPVVSGSTVTGSGTYSTQNGYYTKVGDVVYVSIDIGWTAHTGSGNMLLDGLPFNANASHSYHTLSCNYESGVTNRTTNKHISGGYITPGNNYATLVQTDHAAAGGAGAISLGAAGRLMFNGFYKV